MKDAEVMPRTQRLLPKMRRVMRQDPGVHCRSLNFWCKTVPSQEETWVIIYMVGNLVKSSFQPNKRLLIWTSEQRVMTILLKAAQKPRRRAGI
jgi:hypothetical protein